MRIIILTTLIFCLVACNQQTDRTDRLQQQVDSLRNRVENVYAPSLGEFMSSIQVHHAKLWFAGNNGNWELANFETEEIQEAIEDIQKYCKDRTEITELPMIFPALKNVKLAIFQKNPESFNNSFMLLTKTCNNCHMATQHAFNIIKAPDKPPYSNQVFEKP
jgi:hypothetical protein